MPQREGPSSPGLGRLMPTREPSGCRPSGRRAGGGDVGRLQTVRVPVTGVASARYPPRYESRPVRTAQVDSNSTRTESYVAIHAPTPPRGSGLRESASNESLWRQVRRIPLRWTTHGRIEDIPGFGLSNILPESAPRPSEVTTDPALEQRALPKAVEETDWDARNVRPDIDIDTTSLWLAVEVTCPSLLYS